MSRTARPKGRSEVERQERTAALFLQVADASDRDRRRALQDDVVVLNMAVAHSIAWRFRGRGCALDDLEQTACLALVRAVQDYDPALGHRFLSYAVPCVSGAVRKHFRDYGWTVRPPRAVQELQQRLRTAGSDSVATTGQPRTPGELAAALAVTEVEVREALAARGCFSPASLDLPLADGDRRTLGDLLVSYDDRATAEVEARIVLRPALALLSRADRSVLVMRFVEERSQQQMAVQLGTTQPAVSRLITRILDDMHTSLTVA